MIGFFFIAIAGFAEAVMDKLQFHYNKSIFKGFRNQIFWNPKLSWRNKWKNGNKEEGERFLFSSSLLVGLTDGWHLMKSIRTLGLFLGLFFVVFEPIFISLFYLFIAARILFGAVFTLTFNRILNEKLF